MKRLFIIGASILQLPAIKKAKELGYYVGVADYNSKAVGIAYADEYFNVSTNDQEGIYEAAKAFGADGIMTLATDMPMRSVAYACERLGLIGVTYDTAVKATDKAEMIRVFEAEGVACPWYQVVSKPADVFDIAHKITYPCITKPTDSSGSRGIMLAYNPEELVTAVAYSAENGRGGEVIVEEYMQGPEVSVEVIVWQGEVHILQITDKLTTGAPRFVEMGHTQPSRLSPDTQEKIKDLAGRAVKAVGIENGPAHVEIMVTESGPKMVELGARMGGDCITTHLVPLSTGVDMIKATIDICLGQTPDLNPKWNRGSAIRYLEVPCGFITAIENVDAAKEVPGVQEIAFTAKVGDYAGGIYSSADRIGFVIADGKDADEAEQASEAGVTAIHVTTQAI
ncbi:MAG: ATP-grasp domain-containing protein [Ruminococcaceae bacterium]|nr:ATP-grasp domain-containing protein [Oscillospiraceae bacterium]